MKWRSVADVFPFGKGPFVLLVLAVVSGGWLLFHPVPKSSATLRLWSFAQNHLRSYAEIAPVFEKENPGVEIDLQLVHGDAVTHRLRAALWAGLDVPDLVEVEISVAGTFFRGPLEEMGFVDLKPLLTSSGYYDRILHSRFAPYSHRGGIYGLPKAVCPVMLAYRRDIFEEEGIDPDQLETWDDFIKEARRITKLDERYAINLTDSSQSHFEIFLFQRDGGYFDEDGEVIFDNEIGLETLRWYVPLVAGPDRIAADLGSSQIRTQAIESGYFVSFLCPDWLTKHTENYVPKVSGKMSLMPLPAPYPGGRRTSTQGGTMLAITKKCEDRELAWEAAKRLYLDPVESAERFRQENIIPPLKEAWNHEVFDEPHPYWSNLPVGRLYADLAEQVPPQYTSPFIQTAKQKVGEVVSTCASHYRTHGPEGFDRFAESTLRAAADEVRMYMKRNPF